MSISQATPATIHGNSYASAQIVMNKMSNMFSYLRHVSNNKPSSFSVSIETIWRQIEKINW